MANRVSNVRTFNNVRTTFRMENNSELTSAKRHSIVEQIKAEICLEINNHPEDRQKVINTYKQAIKDIQEDLNHGVIIYKFDNKAHYGKIKSDLYYKLTNHDSSQRKQLECICVHDLTTITNRKFSLWGTNYTGSANKLRDFLKDDNAINQHTQEMQNNLQRASNSEIQENNHIGMYQNSHNIMPKFKPLNPKIHTQFHVKEDDSDDERKDYEPHDEVKEYEQFDKLSNEIEKDLTGIKDDIDNYFKQ